AIDHWIPLADPASPGTVPWNMLPLCHWKKNTKNSSHAPYCNASKGAKDPVVWLTEKLGPRKAKAKLKEIETFFARAQERSTPFLPPLACPASCPSGSRPAPSRKPQSPQSPRQSRQSLTIRSSS